jgi:hypothetical protein
VNVVHAWWGINERCIGESGLQHWYGYTEESVMEDEGLRNFTTGERRHSQLPTHLTKPHPTQHKNHQHHESGSRYPKISPTANSKAPPSINTASFKMKRNGSKAIYGTELKLPSLVFSLHILGYARMHACMPHHHSRHTAVSLLVGLLRGICERLQ